MGPDALAELVDRHAAALVLYARQWCLSPEDVVQGAFLKLARQRTPPDNLLPWLYKVVRNGAIDAARAARRRQKYETRAAERAPDWFLPPDDPSGLDARVVTDALAELPGEIREIMVAHLWGGLTFEQIAATVGGSASTAYRRYAAGLTILREQLGVPCPNPGRT
ncbi:RNA polymerase sigma factor [Fimbriiglobus ruber]|uniref:RNA polymerase, sigma-24 subunit, ECF subfamily n=1 Tax=Fimbriiglobus ruber TaxID=1908690 RepID=A0A225DXQ2_9BACT|nr:sigma-70 family RNA polymerase sigma factor [Fimbriiglobus ruber]OWK45733.1 RNA polymerase, sigma-24 subunit, ECF subfamily [Fimbriiglobus ruber]